ncbi:cyclic AMP receptor 4-like [Mya arenaria]|uniref:cyclic AMP receptor 4-like n=1 Tax=Mya arenaria TaxID=6604 RepID=UPI0022E89CB7|nr:cyclic AMP receptor 4-like [Mya arenaria]
MEFTNDSNYFNQTEVPECSLFPTDRVKCRALLYVKTGTASLSILGSVLTLGLVVLFKKYNEHSQRMIIHLSLATLVFGVTYVIQGIPSENNAICKVQASILQFSVWACLLWIMNIAFGIYFRVVYDINIQQYEKILTFLLWALPLITMALPFSENAYQPAGVWCWLRNDNGWRFGLWYCWRILSIVLFGYTMIHTEITIRRRRRGTYSTSITSLTAMESEIKTLRIYPILYFIVNIFPIINRIQNAAVQVHDQRGYTFTLLLLQTLFDPLFGVTLSLAYVLDGTTRSRLNKAGITDALRRWRSKPTDVSVYRVPEQAPHMKISVIKT